MLGLQGHQRHRQEAVEACFTVAQAAHFAGVSHDDTAALDQDHARLAVRRYGVSETLCTLADTAHGAGLSRNVQDVVTQLLS